MLLDFDLQYPRIVQDLKHIRLQHNFIIPFLFFIPILSLLFSAKRTRQRMQRL